MTFPIVTRVTRWVRREMEKSVTRRPGLREPTKQLRRPAIVSQRTPGTFLATVRSLDPTPTSRLVRSEPPDVEIDVAFDLPWKKTVIRFG